MGLTTIKIDRELHEHIKRILARRELKYKYPSVASFANQAISRKLDSLKQKQKLEIPKPNKVRLGLAKMGFSLRKW